MKGERGIRDSTSELEARVAISGKVAEINEFCTSAEGSHDAVREGIARMMPVCIWNKDCWTTTKRQAKLGLL